MEHTLPSRSRLEPREDFDDTICVTCGATLNDDPRLLHPGTPEFEGFCREECRPAGATPVIFRYTREEAVEDGVLVDVTEWASADKGFHGGFRCPVALTRALWEVVDIDSRKHRGGGDTRGRAHDVLWMGSLALRSAMRRERNTATFALFLSNGRKKKATLRVTADGDGVVIGFPEED